MASRFGCINRRESLTCSKDCGLSHFHDADIKETLIKIAPQEKDTIDASKYGEIVGP
jgi:hypothetical protein